LGKYSRIATSHLERMLESEPNHPNARDAQKELDSRNKGTTTNESSGINQIIINVVQAVYKKQHLNKWEIIELANWTERQYQSKISSVLHSFNETLFYNEKKKWIESKLGAPKEIIEIKQDWELEL